MISGSFGTIWPVATASTSDRLIPHVVFTDPPLARVGLSEGEAQRQGIPVRVAKLPMRKVSIGVED